MHHYAAGLMLLLRKKQSGDSNNIAMTASNYVDAPLLVSLVVLGVKMVISKENVGINKQIN